ncbi:MAG: spore coat protein CotJB [Lachnospiraceae bacterium]|nr:spore coat protein CotJB [Lachnospiraceae bacterium]
MECKEHLAMATIPKQDWCEPYDLLTALEEGTIFPCLNLPFFKAPIKMCNQKTNSSVSNMSQKNREEMMSSLTAISFALNDLTLYLDTHPYCPNGLTLFYQLLEQRLSLLSQFAEKFYPLTQTSMATVDYDKNLYGWSEGPMPWEGACI